MFEPVLRTYFLLLRRSGLPGIASIAKGKGTLRFLLHAMSRTNRRL